MKTRIPRDVATARRPGRPIPAAMGTAGWAQAEADRARIRSVLRAPPDWRAPATTSVPTSTTQHGAPIAASADIVRTGCHALDPVQPRAGEQAETIGTRFHAQPFQAKLAVGRIDDPSEREADRVADSVASGRPVGAIAVAPSFGVQRECAECEEEEKKALRRKCASHAAERAAHAPAAVDRVVAGPGRPLEPALRQDMESRFGHDFSTVRVHSGSAAEQSARDVNAHAYTVGRNIAFGAGRYAPATHEGRRLIAHELAHVVQQSRVEGGVVQRQPAGKTEATYERLVKQGKWCRDSEESGSLHPGLRCYRDIPSPRGYPPGKQVCFSKETGKFVENSPDDISPVSGQNKDGTCDIPVKITDPPHPFTQRGRRGLGHGIADIAPQDPDLVGKWYGRISGVAMGIALPKGTDSDLASWAIPSILGFLAGELGERGLPRLNSLARKHGFVPTMSLGFGSNVGVGLGVGLEKRDRPLPRVPINTYLTFSLDSSLAVGEEAGETSTLLAKVGVRIDPGKQGGLFAVGSVGAGLAAAGDVSGAVSAELGAGFRATDFLDVQVVRETVSGEAGGGTYWLTLKLVAPQRVLKRRR